MSIVDLFKAIWCALRKLFHCAKFMNFFAAGIVIISNGGGNVAYNNVSETRSFVLSVLLLFVRIIVSSSV